MTGLHLNKSDFLAGLVSDDYIVVGKVLWQKRIWYGAF